MKPKVSGIMEVTKSRNEIQIKNTIEKTKLVLLKDKIDKLLVRLTKRKGEMAQINKIRNKRGDLTTYTTEIQRVMRDHYEQFYAKILHNLEAIDQFLETYSLVRLNPNEVENLNRPVTSKETVSVIKNLPATKVQDNSTKHSKKNTHPYQTVPKQTNKQKTREGSNSIHFMRPALRPALITKAIQGYHKKRKL